MKLLEALRHVFNEGKQIRRPNWATVDFVGMYGDRLSIFLSDGEYHDWIIGAEDIVANDWLIL